MPYTDVYSSIIRNSQKAETIQMPIKDKWMNKIRYIHTTEYDSAIACDEVLTHATTWMNLENSMLSERNQS